MATVIPDQGQHPITGAVIAVNADGSPISGASSTIVPGTGATNLGKAEDAVHTSGDVGVMSLGVATDGSTALAAAGDYSVIGTDTAGNTRVVGSVASGATDAGNPVKVGAKYNSTLPTLTDGQRGDAQVGTRGSLNVTLMAVDSTSSIGSSTGASDAVTTSATALAVRPYSLILNGSTWDRMVKPNAASRIASAAASVNATSAKGSAGNVFKAFGNNAKASVIYLKIYNKATAPTVGTDTPVLTVPIAASARFDIDIGGANGFYLGTGIAYGFTTDAADNGTTALLAADILGFTLTYA